MISAACIVFWCAAVSLAHTYVLYPLMLPLLSAVFGRRIRSNDSYQPSVAFLVPVFNEEKVVETKIKNILALEYPPEKLSIWFGSDCSTDATEQIIEACDDSRVHLWRAPQRGGKTGVLNALAPRIDAEIIVFTDANTMHRSDALSHMIPPLADSSVGGVAGHIEHRTKGEQREERMYRSFESGQKRHEALLHSTIGAFGGYYAIRADLFRPIPPNAYSNDDILIPMDIVRRGKRIWFAQKAVSTEDNTEDLKQEFRRRARIGAGNFQSLVWLADFLLPIRGWPWFCYVSHKAGRWLSPLLIIAAQSAAMFLSVVTADPFYCIVAASGLGVVALALLAPYVPIPYARHARYFLAMNLALLAGLGRFLRGIKSAAWNPTGRR